jgi:hypothetical protein
MREFHPVLLWLSDPRPAGLLVVEYPYFETDGTLFVKHDTYAEVFTALTDAGLSVTTFEEHREAPWNSLGEVMMPSPHFRGRLQPPGRQTLNRSEDRYSSRASPRCVYATAPAAHDAEAIRPTTRIRRTRIRRVTSIG